MLKVVRRKSVAGSIRAAVTLVADDALGVKTQIPYEKKFCPCGVNWNSRFPPKEEREKRYAGSSPVRGTKFSFNISISTMRP